jgi:hypothetical protein
VLCCARQAEITDALADLLVALVQGSMPVPSGVWSGS